MSSRLDRLARLERVYLFGAGGSLLDIRPYEVEAVWEHRGRVIFKFRGIESISDAEQLRGAEIRVPWAERFELPQGEYYLDDLVGCEVRDAETGTVFGDVVDWQDPGGSGLLVVRAVDGGEMLIPFARSICVDINLERRQMRVTLPEGLKELNRE